MRHARLRLDAADDLVARRRLHARGINDGGQRQRAEHREPELMQRVAGVRPTARECDNQKQRDDRDQQPQPGPKALERQAPGAEPDLALESRGNGRWRLGAHRIFLIDHELS